MFRQRLVKSNLIAGMTTPQLCLLLFRCVFLAGDANLKCYALAGMLDAKLVASHSRYDLVTEEVIHDSLGIWATGDDWLALGAIAFEAFAGCRNANKTVPIFVGNRRLVARSNVVFSAGTRAIGLHCGACNGI